ncbi:MAG: hypothetical protein KKB31_00300 [Nanoarchaeota archaeon]|nr:hypothetical protein [Nanoarchaeota archaeon]
MSIKNNKRGQVADTITWIVATIILIVVLMVFVFIANLLAKTKKIGGLTDSLDSGGEKEADRVEVKTILAYRLNGLNKFTINNWINESET